MKEIIMPESDTEQSAWAGKDPVYANKQVMQTTAGQRVMILDYLKDLGLYVVMNTDDTATTTSPVYKINPDKLMPVTVEASDQSPQSFVDLAKDAITRSRDQIEAEYSRTANSWLECFGSRVFVLETLASGTRVKDELGVERHQRVLQQLETIKQKLSDLQQRYPTKDTPPPDAIKQELLDLLTALLP